MVATATGMRGFDPDGPYEVEHEDLVYGGPDDCPLLAWLTSSPAFAS